jgi:hypothetical protein
MANSIIRITAFTLIFGAALPATKAEAALYWTRWFSEESPAYAICSGTDEGVVGFQCSGSYCDNIRFLCETLPFGLVSNFSYSWTGYFSEESDGLGEYVSEGFYHYYDENYRVCYASDTGGVVSGMGCRGDYCDDIQLECMKPAKLVNGVLTLASFTNCAWSGWYSEEQSAVDFGWNRYIVGAECSGDYCDNKRFYVCSLVSPGWTGAPMTKKFVSATVGGYDAHMSDRFDDAQRGRRETNGQLGEVSRRGPWRSHISRAARISFGVNADLSAGADEDPRAPAIPFGGSPRRYRSTRVRPSSSRSRCAIGWRNRGTLVFWTAIALPMATKPTRNSEQMMTSVAPATAVFPF